VATGIIYAMSTRDLDLRIAIDDDADVRLLRGALLAAKATELAEMHRRGYRLSTGYGTDSARVGMSAEVAQWRRRIELLDRLIAALDEATGPA
jgi:hypothetical protein